MGRKLPTISTGAALATFAFVPVWVRDHLPVTVLYRSRRNPALSFEDVSLASASSRGGSFFTPLDSGYGSMLVFYASW
jgi:hypothetical protein